MMELLKDPEPDAERLRAAERKRAQIARDRAGLGVFKFVADEETVVRVLVREGVLDPALSDSRPHQEAAIKRMIELMDRIGR
jgi:hypothetical protein